MELDEYQLQAQETDQFPDADEDDGEAISIPILGIVGELGSLVTCFKKRIRDGDSYENFIPELREEIGDVLWYIANLASKFELSLGEIAEENLAKSRDRWIGSSKSSCDYRLYDDNYPSQERLPRQLRLSFTKKINGSGSTEVKVRHLDQDGRLGNPLTNNSYEDDNYCFHDVFHLAYAAILGWSPVIRSLIKAKRKTNSLIDEVEDGARACILEEAISLYVFDYAKRHNFFENVREIDLEIIKTIKQLTSGCEVRNRTPYEWRIAIFSGYEAFRKLVQNEGGVISINLDTRSIDYSTLD